MSECNTSFAQVIGRHFNLHLVAGQDFDIMQTHFTRDVGRDDVAVFQLNTEHGIPEGFDNDAVLFD